MGKLEVIKKFEEVARTLAVAGLESTGNFDGSFIIQDMTTPSTFIDDTPYDPCVVYGQLINDPCCKDGFEECGVSTNEHQVCSAKTVCVPTYTYGLDDVCNGLNEVSCVGACTWKLRTKTTCTHYKCEETAQGVCVSNLEDFCFSTFDGEGKCPYPLCEE